MFCAARGGNLLEITYRGPEYIFPHCELCIHFNVPDGEEPCRSCAFESNEDYFWLNEEIWPAVCDGCASADSTYCRTCAVYIHLSNLKHRLRSESFKFCPKEYAVEDSGNDEWKDA